MDAGCTWTTFGDLEEITVQGAREGTPNVSSDGLTLHYYSERTGGVGQRDLWFATRSSPAVDFDPPNLVPVLNSASWDLTPRLSRDGLTLLFTSNRPGGVGGRDIYFATRSDTASNFDPPTLMPNLNTTEDDVALTITQDGLLAVFASRRTGTTGIEDLWTASRTSTDDPFANVTNLAERAAQSRLLPSFSSIRCSRGTSELERVP